MCSVGCQVEETQTHILDCKHLIEQVEDPSILAEIEYRDIDGTIEEQTQLVKVYNTLLDIRSKMLEK